MSFSAVSKHFFKSGPYFIFFNGDHFGTISVLVNGECVVFVRRCFETNQWAFHMTDVLIEKQP